MPSLQEQNDTDEDIPPSSRVIRSVAVLKDTDPVDLPPLQEAIDTKALDDLVSESALAQCEVAFEYAAVRVHFSTDGNLTVTTADD